MSNASTIRRQIAGTQQLTIAPIVYASVPAPGTQTINFVLNNNGLTLTGGGVIPLSTGVTGLYAGTGQVLRLRAAGTFSGITAGTTTIDLKVWEIPAAVLVQPPVLTQYSQTGFNLVADVGAITPANATGAFMVEVYFSLDAAGNLNGSFDAFVDDAVKTETAIASVTGLVGEADLNFVVSVALAGAEPTTAVITLNEWAIDYV
jgi:hypothetical protein